ncbi:uL15 family ribosomal protein [Candidatus Woesearchaeota archaeon]|nr:uL15 family ribosomal protein [Candidatus Woesearchaeota archaeon]
MTIGKRKKNSRQRASHTHGWGSMKKHRGSGHKGGVGKAGTGKRADSKKPSIWKLQYFGRKGFIPHAKNKEKTAAVNIADIEEHLPKLIKENTAKEENGKYSIDLGKNGYNKLLGKGKVTKKMVIKVASASAGAIEAVRNAGGEVLLEK